MPSNGRHRRHARTSSSTTLLDLGRLAAEDTETDQQICDGINCVGVTCTCQPKSLNGGSIWSPKPAPGNSPLTLHVRTGQNSSEPAAQRSAVDQVLLSKNPTGRKRRRSVSNTPVFECLVLRLIKRPSKGSKNLATNVLQVSTKQHVHGQVAQQSLRKCRADIDIPGTACFLSRPEPKRHCKERTPGERAKVNRMRLRGACFRCRANRWVVSNPH